MSMRGFSATLTQQDRTKIIAGPASHVFGMRAVCDRAGVIGRARGVHKYVLAYGIRVSDHTEVSLRPCHGDCDCISYLLSQ